MEGIYTSGQYLETTGTWHAEDSPWKAEQILKIITANDIRPGTVGEIGCGAGVILSELAAKDRLSRTKFTGYEISAQALTLAKAHESERVRYLNDDLLSESNTEFFDVLLVIDVFEHVSDYLGFIAKCKSKATYKIFHIPLDIHVSSVVRNAFVAGRYTIGHLHYFVAESAIASLRDAGHEIIDQAYTNGAFGLFKAHPTFKRALANIPRFVLSRFSVPLTARLLGGYSLMVLTK
jgi:SAM-dependent methyltransferase